MTRVAAFDCGTNSLRLLIADLDVESGTSEDVVREMRIVRLGQGVDRTGRIADASLQRVFSAVEDYMEQVTEHDVSAIRFCATSAARDAENAEDFVRGIRERVGVDPEVLDGGEEARVSFAGATRSLPPLPEPMLVCDIGGGSTELILGDADGTSSRAESLDIGSVRLNERHLARRPAVRRGDRGGRGRHRRCPRRLLGGPGRRRRGDRGRRHRDHARGRRTRPPDLRQHPDPPHACCGPTPSRAR